MRWTALYAGALALLYIALAFQVIALRRRHNQGIGDGGHKDLARAIRVHANFAENTPFALVLLLITEATGTPAWLVHACGAALLVGRLMHAQGLGRTEGTSVGRYYGMVLTFTSMMVMAGCAIYAGLGQ
jgi:hypothetical protein